MNFQINKFLRSSGQAAMEYMLLLGLIAAIVLMGMQKYITRTQEASNTYFNKIVVGVDGDKPRFCGDEICTPPENRKNCCWDCNQKMCP